MKGDSFIQLVEADGKARPVSEKHETNLPHLFQLASRHTESLQSRGCYHISGRCCGSTGIFSHRVRGALRGRGPGLIRPVQASCKSHISAEKAHKVSAVVQNIVSARGLHRVWCLHRSSTSITRALTGEREFVVPGESESAPGMVSAVGIFDLGELVSWQAYF